MQLLSEVWIYIAIGRKRKHDGEIFDPPLAVGIFNEELLDSFAGNAQVFIDFRIVASRRNEEHNVFLFDTVLGSELMSELENCFLQLEVVDLVVQLNRVSLNPRLEVSTLSQEVFEGFVDLLLPDELPGKDVVLVVVGLVVEGGDEVVECVMKVIKEESCRPSIVYTQRLGHALSLVELPELAID